MVFITLRSRGLLKRKQGLKETGDMVGLVGAWLSGLSIGWGDGVDVW